MCIRKKHKKSSKSIAVTPKQQAIAAPRPPKPKPATAPVIKKSPLKSLPLKTFQRLTPTASQKSTKGSSIFKLKSQSIKVKKDEGLPEIIKAKKPVNKQNSAGMLDLQITPKKSRHGDQTQPKKQSDAILQKQSITNIELISGAPRSMESWTKSCAAIRENTFSDEDIKRTPTERSNVTPQAASENCKVNNTKSPRQVINVITSPSAKQHLDIEKPDPRYSQQQLIYSAFVHQGRFTRSWTFTDIRPEGGLMEQDFLETNAGFSNLLLGCSKADCPLKKSGSWARVSASKNRTITGCCKQQFPGRAAVISSNEGIARSSQSRSRFCARTSKSNSNVKMKSLGLEKKQSSETTMKSKPMHAHTRLHTCRNVACTKGKTESEVRHFERLDVMTDEEDAKMLGEYKRPLDRKDVLKQLDALIIEMNKMPTHININETRP